MFGLWKRRLSAEQAADHFVSALTLRVDEKYKKCIQTIAQVLTDSGMSRSELGTFLNNDETKWAFLVGACSEQLLAPPNVFGEPFASRFIAAVAQRFRNSRTPFGDDIERYVYGLLEMNRKDPMSMSLHTILFMLEVNGMREEPFAKKATTSPLSVTMLRMAVFPEIGGLVKEMTGKYKFR